MRIALLIVNVALVLLVPCLVFSFVGTPRLGRARDFLAGLRRALADRTRAWRIRLACWLVRASIIDHGPDGVKVQGRPMTDEQHQEEAAGLLGYVLHHLGALILGVNRANGWNVTTPADWWGKGPGGEYKIPAVLGLIQSEVSEALEAFRKGDRDNFAEEIADTMIRVLDLTAGLGIDLGPAVLAKIAKNRTRGYRHGGKRV